MLLSRLLASLIFATTFSSLGFAADAPTFEKDVRPIFKTHCFQCHGENGVTEGSLDLRLRRFALAGGDTGAAIHPGNIEDSLLLQRVTSGEMPPEEKRLSAAEIKILSQWIRQGAKTARPEPESIDDADYITEEERNFWSFQPIRRPSVPNINGAEINNPIDAFVLARSQTEGLGFSDPADAHTLIRRATFDLWGLPPTPEMVDTFVHDDDPNAYAKLIDRLLASNRYGERWGRHWLDVAGYADSEGYTNQDVERQFAYFYRDYVIDSFNADKPLDQFVREQLAGDELPHDDPAQLGPRRIAQLTATGFLRMAPDGTSVGGVDKAEAANQNIADTIDIVSTSLLGLTVGCARCHDHRYDPISQADYYRMRAIFEPALDWKKWRVPNQRRVSLYTDDDKQKRAAVEERAKEAEAARTRRQQEHIDRTLYEELLVVPDDRREALKTAFTTAKDKRTKAQVALLEEFPSIGNISGGSLYLYAEQRARRAGDIEKAADQRETKYLEKIRQKLLAKAPADKRELLRKLISVPADKRDDAQQKLATEHPEVFVTAEDLQQHDADAFAEVKRYREAALICRKQDAKTELRKMQEAVKSIRSAAPPERFIRVLQEPSGHTPPTHLFIRGDHNQPGKQLAPGELTVLASLAPAEIVSDDPRLPSTGRRLAYAQHLTNGKHPLLARVLMNRVWLHHFGRGIVSSPGDFGSLGAKPTHPELLDWLSDNLMRNGWNLKRMHRLIMLSHTYRQRSDRTDQLDRIDPDNRLYARMSARRLETEAVRDAVLAASGTLLDQLHGPPIPVKEDAVGQIVLGKEMLDGERKPTGADKTFAGASRRSIYVQVRRTRPLAVLETFDVASSSPNCTKRNFSNVATQSLMLMNSQFIIDHANKLADDLMTAGNDIETRLSIAWRRCFGRTIDNSVLVELREFTIKQAAEFRSRDAKRTAEAAQKMALASAIQAMFSSNEFIYVD